MKLIWDNSRFKVMINQVDIHIAPEDHPPFPVTAIAEEQDTSLVLKPDDDIHVTNDAKPLWYDSNTAALLAAHQPGDVLIKSFNPMRLLAIVHDLDRIPSWQSEWIKMALEKVLAITNEKSLSAIGIPVLGAQFGRFKLEEFTSILVSALNSQHFENPLRIWLLVRPEDCLLTAEYFRIKVANMHS